MSQNFWNTVSFHLLKLVAFKISGLKILKLCLNILNVPMLILLVAYVTKYHWGIQTTCNNLLQLSKWKQGSAISGVVEGACTEFMRERPCRDPLVQLRCIVLEQVFIRESTYLQHIKTFVFVSLKGSENKDLNHVPPNACVLL